MRSDHLPHAHESVGDVLRRSYALIHKMERLLWEFERAKKRGKRLVFTAEQRAQIEAAFERARRLGFLHPQAVRENNDTPSGTTRRRPLPHSFG
jgi:hypothetical protein